MLTSPRGDGAGKKPAEEKPLYSIHLDKERDDLKKKESCTAEDEDIVGGTSLHEESVVTENENVSARNNTSLDID